MDKTTWPLEATGVGPGVPIPARFLRSSSPVARDPARASIYLHANSLRRGNGGMTINSSQLPDSLLEALGMPNERGYVLKLVKAANGRMQIDDIMDEEGEDDEEEDAAAPNAGAGEPDQGAGGAGEKGRPLAAAAAAGEPLPKGDAGGKRKRMAAAGAAAADASAQNDGGDEDGGSAAVGGEVVVEELSSPPADDYSGPSAGCTAVCAAVRGDLLVVANAGDSRCVLSRGGRAVALTQDHKPTDPEEYARIIKVRGACVHAQAVLGGWASPCSGPARSPGVGCAVCLIRASAGAGAGGAASQRAPTSAP
jgi:hypothetical protein